MRVRSGRCPVRFTALSRCALRVRRGCPAAPFFFCLPKRRRQEKGTPGSPPLRGALRYSDRRAAAELALARSVRGLRQSSPKAPGSPAFLGGSHGAQGPHHRSQWAPVHGTAGRKRRAAPLRGTPCEAPSIADVTGDVGEHCLSPRMPLAGASCAAARRVEKHRAARRAAEPGAAFFGYFLGPYQESDRLPGRPRRPRSAQRVSAVRESIDHDHPARRCAPHPCQTIHRLRVSFRAAIREEPE